LRRKLTLLTGEGGGGTLKSSLEYKKRPKLWEGATGKKERNVSITLAELGKVLGFKKKRKVKKACDGRGEGLKQGHSRARVVGRGRRCGSPAGLKRQTGRGLWGLSEKG